jgi:hypothetical protein
MCPFLDFVVVIETSLQSSYLVRYLSSQQAPLPAYSITAQFCVRFKHEL